MYWWKRYEPILEQRPVSGEEALRDLIAKELVELYENFPPPEESVAWEDPVLARKYAGRLAELPKLAPPLVDLLTRILVLDLAHDIDAIDHMLRNNHHRAVAQTQGELDALMLLWRVILEHLEVRKEETQGILKRKDLPDIAERARARFRVRALSRM